MGLKMNNKKFNNQNIQLREVASAKTKETSYTVHSYSWMCVCVCGYTNGIVYHDNACNTDLTASIAPYTSEFAFAKYEKHYKYCSAIDYISNRMNCTEP